MFKDLSSNNRYIGSAVCLRSRRYSHKQEAKKRSLNIFYNYVTTNGWDYFSWDVVQYSTNFLHLFKQQYPDYTLNLD